MTAAKAEIYDTTLRDGSQQVGLDLTVADKLHVAAATDDASLAALLAANTGEK